MARLCMSLAILATNAARVAGVSCQGPFDMPVAGGDAMAVSLVPTGWGSDGGVDVEVDGSGHVTPRMNGRAYFATSCTEGQYSNEQYVALNLLGKTMRYTTDMQGAGCGCNAAFYLVSMRQNTKPSDCKDYYCDANKVCGIYCAEIDIQEANEESWHSTLHTAHDSDGVAKGIGGGGKSWSGPRDWNMSEYGEGGMCIDTKKPFQVAVSFPVNSKGVLVSMDVELSQNGKPCNLSLSLDQYEGMEELSEAIEAGMTPVVSYWASNDMLWMDGQGKDKEGPCRKDHRTRCGDAVKFYDFSMEKAMPRPSPSEPEEEEEFCCLASGDSDDFCGGCHRAARAAPETRCGISADGCKTCGGDATWCKADSWQASSSNTNNDTSPSSVAEGIDGAYCCLAAPVADDVCGSCPTFGRASAGSPCSHSASNCKACGGQATWCEGANASITEAPKRAMGDMPDNGDGYCCLAAKDDGDFCGTCFPAAVAGDTDGKCSASPAACKGCRDEAQWCKKSGSSKSKSGAGFCCLAAADSSDHCGSCHAGGRATSSSHCGLSRESCEACGGNAQWCEEDEGEHPMVVSVTGDQNLKDLASGQAVTLEVDGVDIPMKVLRDSSESQKRMLLEELAEDDVH